MSLAQFEYDQNKQRVDYRKSQAIAAEVMKYFAKNGKVTADVFKDRVKRARASELSIRELDEKILGLQKEKALSEGRLKKELDLVAEGSWPKRGDRVVDCKLTPSGPWQLQFAEARWKGKVITPIGKCSTLGRVEEVDEGRDTVTFSLSSYSNDIRKTAKDCQLTLPIEQCITKRND